MLQRGWREVGKVRSTVKDRQKKVWNFGSLLQTASDPDWDVYIGCELKMGTYAKHSPAGEFNFDQFGLLISDCVGADFKLRAHFRNSMQIGMSLKASPEGKRECRVAQRRR